MYYGINLLARIRSDTDQGARMLEQIDRMAMLLGDDGAVRRANGFAHHLHERWRRLGGTVAAVTDAVTSDPMNRREP